MTIKALDLFERKEKVHLIYTFFAMLIVGGLEVAGIASILPFMSVVSNPESIETSKALNTLYTFFGFTDKSGFLFALGIVVFILIMVTNIFSAFLNWWTTYFVNMQSHRVSTRLLNQYLFQPYMFFLDRNSSDLSKNIINEVYRCVGGIFLPFLQILSKVIVTIFVITLLLFIDITVALTAMFVLGLSYFLVYKIVRKRLHMMGVLTSETNLDRYKITNEAISGIKELKLSGGEQEFVNRFTIPSKNYAEYSANSAAISALPRYLLEAIAFGGIIALILVLIKSGGASGEVIPIISLYALAGYRLLPAMQQIYSGVTRIRYNFPALKILLDDFSRTNKNTTTSLGEKKSISFNKMLQLKDINFTYPNSKKPILQGFDMNILPHTTVGIVGETGSGKTTLIDILLGLLPQNSGEILVDDIEINESNISAYQKNIGYVPQSIYLMDDTIANNIAFAISDDNIDTDMIVQSAHLAELHDFVQTLPDGYQTIVGERGVRLSGGQRQRIGIARALYRNPEIIVLDEATSALDGITENVIMDAINNLAHKKTIIMIAHRISTLKECDVIYVLSKGEIVDSGTYNELMLSNSRFSKMANN